jgi:hypothetical protein
MIPAPRPGVGGGARYQQAVTADWLVREHGGFTLYFVQAYRDTNPIGINDTLAFVGRTRCSTDWHPGYHGLMRTTCAVVSRGRFVPAKRFTMDLAMSTARVTLHESGFTHRIEWTSATQTAPSVSHSEYINRRTAAGDASLGRRARAHGRLFGRNLGTASYALLQQGVSGSITYDQAQLAPMMHALLIAPRTLKLRMVFRTTR